ncbi:MAG: SCO family protein [Verrucomicrobia bacterium]|nr:SCO family protein [Verrucomicrobiota bacterium]
MNTATSTPASGPTPRSRAIQWTVWGGLTLVILTVCAIYLLSVLRGGSSKLPVISTLPDFTLTNHLGQTVRRADLAGRVWVADIIFTRCPGPCADMTRRMKELQSALPENTPVRLISLTTDPDFDSPKVLKAYADRFGAQPHNWQFLTGAKPELFRLAVDGLKLTAIEVAPADRKDPEDFFIHSTFFVLVDKQGRLRAAHEATEPGWQERIKADLAALEREP